MRVLRLLVVLPFLLVGLAACGADEDQPAGETSSKPLRCSYTETGEASKKAELPPTVPVSADSVTITTNFGVIKATLLPKSAPCTVNSFVSLAKQTYFDGTRCHRLVPGFVLQCGDPSASGMGGPGYRFEDELTGSETYPAGTLAMANSGPDTNGSQFFIVLDDAQLSADYTVFGKVDAQGLAVAKLIESKGNGVGPAPAEPVEVTSVTVP
jgi:peptidyl-prolyl cis-trans isomerase B (cyclophilin B)